LQRSRDARLPCCARLEAFVFSRLGCEGTNDKRASRGFVPGQILPDVRFCTLTGERKWPGVAPS
jgi:hypothetical protein